MAKYTTILFDADDTLLDFHRGEEIALHDVFKENGLRTDAEFIASYDEINTALWEQYNRGEIEKSEITDTRFQRLFDRYSIALNGAKFNDLYIEQLAKYGFPLPGAEAICRKLFENGMQMYIITNGIGMVQKNRLQNSGLAPFFKGVFISEEIGVGKPHREFFDRVLEQIEETDKNKIIVVGDSLSADIGGGIGAGLVTMWCDFQKTNRPNEAHFRVENFEQMQKILLGE